MPAFYATGSEHQSSSQESPSVRLKTSSQERQYLVEYGSKNALIKAYLDRGAVLFSFI